MYRLSHNDSRSPSGAGTARLHRTPIACVLPFVLGLMITTTTAWAQMPTVSPSGETPRQGSPPAQSSAPQQPVVIPVQVDGNADGTTPDPTADLGYYHTDDMGTLFGTDRDNNAGFAVVPSHHVVRKGDTLWDICWFYFNNPWEWPKIWSYNQAITNPHWIYPGDLVRLYPRGLETPKNSDLDDPEEPPDASVQPTPAQRYGVRLRQTAFVDREQLEFVATLDGAEDEKLLLATGDSVYLSYQGKTPKVGDRFAIFTETRKVRHPKKKKKSIGAFVRIIGELQIKSVKKGKRARAVITDAIDVIERGARVGPLQRTYRTVEPQRNEVDLQGTIVALISSDELIGQGQIIFIDSTEDDGLKVGNRMYVVRRGDAYEEIMGPAAGIGQDDRRFPARAVGEIIIVQTGKRVSVAMVTLALQEIGVGDLVLMRKARK